MFHNEKGGTTKGILAIGEKEQRPACYVLVQKSNTV